MRRLRPSLLAVLFLAACGERPTAYVNGRILTMDPENRVATTVLVRDGRIDAVGNDEDVRAAVAGVRIVDLEGRTMLPGFVDAHSHFPGAGLDAVMADLQSPPVGNVRAVGDVVAALRKRSAEAREGDWILGFGYDDTLLAERRHPNRAELDSVSTRQPIWILHVSGHLGVANSRALELAGMDAKTPDPEGGVIQRDAATGEPNGVLEESARWRMQEHVPDFSFIEKLRIVRAAVRAYRAAGVTTAQNGLADRSQIEALAWLSRLGIVPLRLVVWPNAEVGREMLEGRYDPERWNGDFFHVGAVKLIGDGSIQGYTAYLSQPYPPSPGRDSGYRGYPAYRPEELGALVERFHAAGRRLAIHGNGDGAIDQILDAFEKAQARRHDDDPRLVLVHAQTARRDQLARMKALGVTPSFFVAHTHYWGDRHRDVFLGRERAERISPTRSARDLGVRFSLHSDTPVVPISPLLSVWAAVNRETSSGKTLGAPERIGVVEALRAVTIDAAWQSHLESDRGSIEPGKLADFVILSRDPREEPGSIRDIDVVETVVAGRTIYRRDGSAR